MLPELKKLQEANNELKRRYKSRLGPDWDDRDPSLKEIWLEYDAERKVIWDARVEEIKQETTTDIREGHLTDVGNCIQYISRCYSARFCCPRHLRSN